MSEERRSAGGELHAERRSSGLYLATITVEVPLKVAPGRIGGKDYTADGIAAWAARSALDYMIGNETWQRIGEAGADDILGLTGDVTHLERLDPNGAVSPDYTDHCCS